MLGFEERENLEKTLGARREPTSNSTHTGRESNWGHIGGRRTLSTGTAPLTLLSLKGISLKMLPCDLMWYITVILECKLVCYIWSSESEGLDILQDTVSNCIDWCGTLSWKF